MQKNANPTGTVAFVDAGRTVAGPTTCTSTTDSSGNYACQASATFTVSDGFGVTANYSGDSNYPPSSGWASIVMPDFNLNANQYQVTTTAGGPPQTVTFNISSSAGFAGTVTNFTCSGLPAETTCTFSPSQVTANPTQMVSTILTIATTAIGQSRPAMRAASGRSVWLAVAGAFLVGACLIGFSGSRNRGLSVGLMVLALALTLPSCGGGSGGTGGTGGGGGGGGVNNPVPHITSLSPSQIAAGSQINNLTINGTNFMGGATVTIGGVAASGYIPSSSQMVVYPSTSQLATVAQLPVVVSNPPPGGGASNSVNFVVTTGTPTGNFNVTVTASSGGLTHSAQLYLIVQ